MVMTVIYQIILIDVKTLSVYLFSPSIALLSIIYTTFHFKMISASVSSLNYCLILSMTTDWI